MFKARKAVKKATGNTAQQPVPAQDLQQLIARKAYEIYEKSGCVDGCHLEHWLEAERSVKKGLGGILP